MADFNEIKDTVIDAATGVCKNATSRAARLAEEIKIKELYYKLGREYYASLQDDCADLSNLEELCREIKVRVRRVEALKKKCTLEHMKSCPECGAVNCAKNFVCDKCGGDIR